MKKRIIIIVSVILVIGILTGTILFVNRDNKKEDIKLEEKMNNKVKIKFDTNGGSLVGDILINKNSKILEPKSPELEGYTFMEWQVDDKKFDFDTEIKEDIVLKAFYKSNDNKDDAKNEAKFVESKKEVKTEESPGKYGTKIIKTTTYTYDLYSDGSKKNEKRKTTEKVDTSGFNATANDLLAEAKSNVNNYKSKINDVLNSTNDYRNKISSPNLVLNDELVLAASVRALEVAYTGKTDHTRPDNRDFYTIGNDLKLSIDVRGENIAWGSQTGAGAVKIWADSLGHYKNMTSIGYGKLGVGVAYLNGRWYWVQIFSL